MSLYIPDLATDDFGPFVQGVASNFNLLEGSQIVEHGENENGEYIRWENGLQICLPNNVGIEEGLPGSTSVAATFQFPAIFATEPRLLYSTRRRGGSSLSANADSAKNIYRMTLGTAGSVKKFYLTVVETIPVSSSHAVLTIGTWKEAT